MIVSVRVESIDYRIFGYGQAIIQSWHNAITTILPRHCAMFHGTRVSIADLRITGFGTVVRTILIPYSMHTTDPVFPALLILLPAN
jgi:hypothetical protein